MLSEPLSLPGRIGENGKLKTKTRAVWVPENSLELLFLCTLRANEMAIMITTIEI
jgi:hypothetical protein